MTDISLPGVITMGFHFIESMDALVSLVVDPVTKTPEMRIRAVRIAPEMVASPFRWVCQWYAA